MVREEEADCRDGAEGKQGAPQGTTCLVRPVIAEAQTWLDEAA